MHIPGYRIIRKINQGGMATVYLAIQTSVGRVVALKVMSPSLNGDPTFSERFQREANIVGQLSHPHIVSIYDIGRHENLNYIAMDYLPGGSIHEKMLSGISQELALRILKDIASALDHAHEKGYIHRDIKPENILFRDDDYAVLTDFGVARTSSGNSRNTLAGTVVGTPHYMSPEQTRGKTVDARSDLYSLGIVFYEMLTGSVPYKGEEAVTIALKHLAAPIPTLPAHYLAFQPLVDKLLSKDPEERYQKGRELVNEINAIEFQIQNNSGIYDTTDTTLAQQFSVLFKILLRKIRAYFKRQSHKCYFYLKSLRWTKETGFYRKLPIKVDANDNLTSQNTLIATRLQKQLTGKDSGIWQRFTENKYHYHMLAVGIISITLMLLAVWPSHNTPDQDVNTLAVTSNVEMTPAPIAIASQVDTKIVVTENTSTVKPPATQESTVHDNNKTNAVLDEPLVESVEKPIALTDIQETPVTPQEPIGSEIYNDDTYSLPPRIKQNTITVDTVDKTAIDKPLEQVDNDNLYTFSIITKPRRSKVRILNIKEKFSSGMSLPPGKYQVEVTHSGFRKYKHWITLPSENLVHRVKLKKDFISGNVFRHTLTTGVTGPSMIVIPRGSFTMGGIQVDNRPKHKVTFKDPIAVSRHEITFNDYEPFAKAKSMPLPGDNRWGRNDRPVINISWEEAQMYTQWLSKKSGHAYRLPTEAEWEYIATSGDAKVVKKGLKKRANCKRGCLSEYTGIFSSKSAPIGQFEANSFGVFDTAGNVAEWVADCYQDTYKNATRTGSAVKTKGCTKRVVRGGSMQSNAAGTASDKRSSQQQHTFHKDIGFRVVAELK